MADLKSRKLRTSLGIAARLVALTLVVATPSATASQTPSSDPAAAGLRPQGPPVVVATKLAIPWAVAFAGDEVLVSERNTANILALRPGQAPRVIGKVPNVTAQRDGGLLGLAVLKQRGRVWIYAFHSTTANNRIVRMPYRRGVLGDAEIILDGLPGGSGHNGGRIAFGPDGMLYAATGESHQRHLSQDLTSHGGKILRMRPDGGVPKDNPFKGSLVYSFGHRNPGGLAWDRSGQLWQSEFGDRTWDELNRIEPGKNYGWPVVEGRAGNPAYVDPVAQWPVKELGPSGLAHIDGTLFLGGLTGRRIWTVTFDAAGQPVATAHYAGEFGRIRDVLEGPDGRLWVMTNKTDGRGDKPNPDDDRILSIALTR